MDFLKYSSNIKAGLFLLGFFLIIFLLSYTQGIVNELRNDNGEIVSIAYHRLTVHKYNSSKAHKYIKVDFAPQRPKSGQTVGIAANPSVATHYCTKPYHRHHPHHSFGSCNTKFTLSS